MSVQRVFKEGDAGCLRDAPGGDALLSRTLIFTWLSSIAEKQDDLDSNFTSN